MTATESGLAHPTTQISGSPHPLLAVMMWELRRVFSRRATWLILPLAFGFFLFVIWLLWIMRYAGAGGFGDGVGHEVTFYVSVTSAEGTVMILPVLSFLLALIVPFVNTDGTAGDLKRRTHELVMSTRLPSWAYLWGRYAACLLLSLGLAVSLLVALLLMGLILHQTQADYPLPQFEAIVSIWAVALAPTTILISSVSFALGTLLRRGSTLAALGIILGWFLCIVVLPTIPAAASGRVPSWYLHWEPTNTGMAAALQAQYTPDPLGSSVILNPTPQGNSDSAFLAASLKLEQRMPDLAPWILPHVAWIGVGLALMLIAWFSFRRFRNAAG